MKLLKLTSHLLAAGSLVGLLASPAIAGNCQTRLITFPAANGQDFVNMSCQRFSGDITAGAAIANFIGGQKKVLANKTSGGAVRDITSQGLDASGNQVCIVQDFTIGGGNPSANCPNATTTRYRGILHHAE